jgi:A/G-specific adenine glycosylase
VNRTRFRRALLGWYDSSRRDLPWRQSRAFYPVWLSEIMLQQTRVEAVIPYYLRFLARFPTPAALAAAPESDVLAAWSGLGYYSRARNLQRAARQLAARGLPATYEEVLSLPGAGPYTAAAIASIALDLPHAAVDGNVMRVISRLTDDATEISSAVAKRRFATEANALLHRGRPGDFNQAMMELGATICVPRSPDCAACPVAAFCAARAAGRERELPVKLKKPAAREVRVDLALLQSGDRILLVKRSSSERRLADFWELPPKHLFDGLRFAKAAEFSHRIVNDCFRITIWRCRSASERSVPERSVPERSVPERSVPESVQGTWFSLPELKELPLTTVTRKALADSPNQVSPPRKGGISIRNPATHN